ncbi:hypothetical protein M3Y99_00900100 [Aphelenchoides fujianensis]|nr:hypothetical protein M3Y99_00900100 [Aphelenchoides fujianensis]
MKRPTQMIELYLPNGKLAEDESKCLRDFGIKSGTTLAFKLRPAGPPPIDVQFAASYFKTWRVYRIWDLCKQAKEMEQQPLAKISPRRNERPPKSSKRFGNPKRLQLRFPHRTPAHQSTSCKKNFAWPGFAKSS